jgi:hypothetical protein
LIFFNEVVSHKVINPIPFRIPLFFKNIPKNPYGSILTDILSKPISDYSPEIGKYNPNGDKKGNFIKGQRVNTFTNIIKQVNFKTSFFNKIANTVRNFRFENEEPTNNNLV